MYYIVFYIYRYILVSNILCYIISPYFLLALSKLYCCSSLVKFNDRNLCGGFSVVGLLYQCVATPCLV